MSGDPKARSRHPALLKGKTVFLSASVPDPERDDRFQSVPYAEIQIREAVVSLTRSIISQEGRLVMGGHPSITPLVGLVALEYQAPPDLEEDKKPRPVVIYQSEAYRGHLPDDTWQLFRSGFADLRWTEAEAGETFDPKVKDRPQCPESLRRLREEMLKTTKPVAAVYIGGMDGVVEEMSLFRELCQGKIYVFAETGGAASYVAARDNIPAFDREVLDRLAGPKKNTRPGPEIRGTSSGSRQPEIRVIPYPLICQLLVREIAHLGSN